MPKLGIGIEMIGSCRRLKFDIAVDVCNNTPGICTIVDMDSLEIEVDVNESFIGLVSTGQKVDAHLDAYSDWLIPASVIAIIPTADRAKATVKVRIKIETKDSRILPEMGVKVAFY